MSDIHPCQYDHTPDHIPTQPGEKGYCKVCLEYDYVAEVSGVNPYGPGSFLRLGLRWTPCISALEIEARKRREPASTVTTSQGALGHGQRGDEPHPDGLEGGRWLWWKNKRLDVPKGVVYRLLEYMWDRSSASYNDLEDAGVFESAVAPQTVRSYANKANNALPTSVPWRLSTDSVARQLTKVPAAKGA